MNLPGRISLAVAISAVLLAAGAADAGMGKKSKKSAAKAPAVATAPASGVGSMGQGIGMGSGAPGTRGMGGSFLLDRFDDIDADKNGQLSRDEIKAWIDARQQEMRQRIGDHIKAADKNADGQISREEAQLGLPMLYEHFEFVDVDGNGQITPAEFERLRDRDAIRAQVAARVAAADQDKDGKLNLAETQAAFPGLAARFSVLDTNGDGFLTLDDFAKFMGPH